MLTLIARSIASAERSFHKSLAALAKLQKARGFVPQKPVEEPLTPKETGFVPTESPDDIAEQPTELKAFERMGYFPEDMEKYVESIVNSGNNLPHNPQLL